MEARFALDTAFGRLGIGLYGEAQAAQSCLVRRI